MKVLDGLEEIDKARFDIETERFSVKFKEGSTLTQATIEKHVLGSDCNSEGNFEMRWEVTAKDAGFVTDKAVSFTAELLSGEKFELNSLLGKKVVVLNFFASWCAPCLEEIPHLVALQAKYEEIAIVGVSIDEPDSHETLEQIVANKKIPYPVVLDSDGAIVAKWAANQGIPLTFVIDLKGKVTAVFHDYKQGDEKRLEQSIEVLFHP